MKRIYYKFAKTTDDPNAVYGQILSEKNSETGHDVSKLTITGSTTRTETRPDGKTRTFVYNSSALLTSVTDFKGVAESRVYTASFLTAVTDRRGYTTNFTNNAWTGGKTQVQFPAVSSATPAPAPRGTVTTTLGWAACPDVNNRDANNPYYPYSIADEGGNATNFTRDTSKRVTRIDYPDTGYETFTYNSFGQVLTHRLKTGGTESFTYNGTGQKLTYRNPDNATGDPTAQYAYDTLGRVSAVCDALGASTADLNHTTSFAYNDRGQLTTTTLPIDPVDGVRHTLVNAYNADGTRASATDQRGKITTYTYDEYRRPLTVTTPLRFAGDTTPRTTSLSYDKTQGTALDFTHTDSQVRRLTLPSGNIIRTYYDENFRKTSEIASASDAVTDAATTSYVYDNEGNVTSMIAPNQQAGQPHAGKSTVSAYDERNRPISVTDALLNVTSTKYDWAGRPKIVTRANGQTVVYDAYDAMNHLLQHTVKQTPNPDAVTKYTYAATGLLQTMQDPRLVALGSTYNYAYTYDLMGRTLTASYPPAVSGAGTSETFTYDTVGRLWKFTNRDGKLQTFSYDALHRPTGFTWNDSVTPSVTLGYDIGSRVTSINNTNATISRTYFDDNLLNTETQTPVGGGSGNTVTYGYNADRNRATLQYPGGAYSFTYGYTGRDQLNSVANTSPVSSVATFAYDVNGNLTGRTPANSTSSTYTYDALNQPTNISHALAGTTRTLQYAYDNVNRRTWQRRDAGDGDVFGYDLNDQVTATKLNIANPDTTSVGAQTIVYDANGNRTSFAAYGPTDTYYPNNLSQYTSRNTTNATYDTEGNLTSFGVGTSYVYDAQNRLTSATGGGSTTTFKYDGLNRQVGRTVSGVTTYSVWDGWNLIKEYQGTNTTTAAFASGPAGLIKDLLANKYFYQDASGSTSHLASSTGQLLEWYRYDLQGTPFYYDAANNGLTATAHNVNYLFTGQRWMTGLNLYDLRNRFYSPDLGRFLQPDPIGFAGDPTNLYRYCGGDPVNNTDPFGLWQVTIFAAWKGGAYTTFGINNGQWNFGGAVGVGFGAYVGFDPFPSRVQPSAINHGLIGTVGAGFPGAYGGRITGYVGEGGSRVSGSGRLGHVSHGFETDGTTTRFNDSPTFSLGGGFFAGLGQFIHGPVPSTTQQRTDYAPLGNRAIQAWDANGNPISVGPWNENVVSTPVDGRSGGSGGPPAVGPGAPGWSQSTSGSWAPTGMWGLSGFAATFGHAGGAPRSAGLHPDEKYYKLN